MDRATAVIEPRASDPGLHLVRSAARGDVAAFEQLVAGRTDRVYRAARSILGSEADARDATQEAMVAAWRALPRLRDARTFDGWLYRILVNVCRVRLRDRRRVREISLHSYPTEPPLDGPAFDQRIHDADTLSRAFDRLGADKRSILVMHYQLQESVAAIATALEIPAGTVKWRLSEARAALARALLAEGEAPR